MCSVADYLFSKTVILIIIAVVKDCVFFQFPQDYLRSLIQKLYTSIIVGNSPCHGFTKVEGRTGGFYHVVCRHRVGI